jgi:AcrR family transcriptional regulator
VSIAEPSGFGSERSDLADRILEAARQLVLRSGVRKLSLADVATLAGVSRPTIYRYFVSKEDLIGALGEHERRRFDAAMEQATSGVTGAARLEAAVDVVASFLEDQPPGRQLDLDPGFAQDQMARALPMISKRLTVVLEQCAREGALDAAPDARDLAGAIARVAMSHYMFREKDPAAARREIRATAGLAGSQSKRRRVR